MANITIDGKEYALESLSDKARAELGSMQLVDQKLAQAKGDLAIYQTARNAFTQALATMLPAKQAAKTKKKDVITVDDKRYNLDDFSDEAKAQLTSIQVAGKKITEVQTEIAMLVTARNAYANALKAALK